MRIDTVSALMDRLIELFGEVSFPSDTKRKQWEPQYRSSLSHLTPDEINTTFHACMDGWKKKSAPMPADILSASTAVAGPAAIRHGQRSEKQFRADLAAKDLKLRELKQEICDQFRDSKAKTFALAREEGWLGLLQAQVAMGANILAQRQVMADSGANPPQLSEYEKADYAIGYGQDGREEIQITRAHIDIWKDWLSTPAKRISNNIPKMSFAGEAA